MSSGRPTRLDPEQIQKTIDHLSLRLEARFPDSGLSRVGRDLGLVAAETKERVAWISRPILGLRVAVAFLILLISALVFFAVAAVRTPNEPLKLVEFTQGVESGINDVILVGAGIFFLVTAERRIKRRRALSAINELRAIAHLIDMHQLTKDPEWVLGRGEKTGVLAPREMSRFELSRYLDYCSEMLSLTSKIAALYIQDFDDEVALSAVNEVEDLTTGLSQKIWQKLMILLTNDD